MQIYHDAWSICQITVVLNLLPYNLNYMWHSAQYVYYKGVFPSLVFSFMVVTYDFL